MKFILGLLAGSLGVLVVSSITDFDWQPPTRMHASLSVPETQPETQPQTQPESESNSEPVRSVTIAPLPPEPLPTPSAPPSQIALSEKAAPPIESELLNEREQPNEPVLPAGAGIVAVNETAVIWKPFHSEVSAEGFARRLSTQLGYPFRALREGPAKYHVVFDYGSDQQRELLRTQVQALTGFSLL